MLYRIGFNVFILLSLVFMPWQSTVLFLLAGFFLYERYFEGLAWAMMIDVLYGSGVGDAYWYSVYGVVAFVLVARIKQYMWWYD